MATLGAPRAWEHCNWRHMDAALAEPPAKAPSKAEIAARRRQVCAAYLLDQMSVDLFLRGIKEERKETFKLRFDAVVKLLEHYWETNPNGTYPMNPDEWTSVRTGELPRRDVVRAAAEALERSGGRRQTG